MSVVYLSVRGDPNAGGPSVFCHKFARGLVKLGHKVIYDSPNKANFALCIIESGKVLRSVDRSKTKVAVRLDGAYFEEYNKLFKRTIRPDMVALHNAIKRDVEKVDLMIYQSQFSKDLIDAEIAKRSEGFVVIGNGADTNNFKPTPRLDDGFVNLLHVGKMRDQYLMESLVGVYSELRARNKKIRLILVGNMDSSCSQVYNRNKADPNIKYLGPFSNDKLVQAYAHGDVYLGPRMGSSSDNVIAEAQACGLPVLIPSWSGNCELVADKQSGIIVQSGHWDYGIEYNKNLANGVEEIMKDLGGFKKRARKYAVESLSLELMISKYLKALENLR